MSYLHKMEAMAEGNLIGLRAGQRDWSPFVAHFTSHDAMRKLRRAVSNQLTPVEVSTELRTADAKSFESLRSVLKDRRIVAKSPSEEDEILSCVCLSECTLPGLISHAERYGRCGIVFEKEFIYGVGGRPCFYVSKDVYTEFEKLRKAGAATGQTIHSLANVYTIPGEGKIQDFTHEREWRVFMDVDLGTTPIVAIIVPTEEYVGRLAEDTQGEIPVVPLRMLYRWGV